MSARSRISAGILLFRRTNGPIEFLLAHPGGPLFARRDAGCWSIPKGEVESRSLPNEARPAVGEELPGTLPTEPTEPTEDDLLAVACREFAEETGWDVPAGPLVPLGWIRQKGGKVVHAWAVEGDLDPATATSNTFEMEWPPRSGRIARFPEIDRVAWYSIEDARRHLKETQVPLLERLMAQLEGRSAAS